MGHSSIEGQQEAAESTYFTVLSLEGRRELGCYPPVPISQSQGLLPGELLISHKENFNFPSKEDASGQSN